MYILCFVLFAECVGTPVLSRNYRFPLVKDGPMENKVTSRAVRSSSAAEWSSSPENSSVHTLLAPHDSARPGCLCLHLQFCYIPCPRGLAAGCWHLNAALFYSASVLYWVFYCFYTIFKQRTFIIFFAKSCIGKQ